MKTKNEICEKLEKTGKEFNESLGSERFEVLRQAVAGREKKVAHFQILKYAALIAVLLGCLFLFRSLVTQKPVNITEKKQPEPVVEKVDLAWDYELNINSLRSKITRFKRKVNFSDLRDDQESSFDYKCKTIKKQTYKIKNAKQI